MNVECSLELQENTKTRLFDMLHAGNCLKKFLLTILPNLPLFFFLASQTLFHNLLSSVCQAIRSHFSNGFGVR